MSQIATRILLRDDPHVDWEENTMEFRLTYQGPILSETTRDGAVRARITNKRSGSSFIRS